MRRGTRRLGGALAVAAGAIALGSGAGPAQALTCQLKWVPDLSGQTGGSLVQECTPDTRGGGGRTTPVRPMSSLYLFSGSTYLERSRMKVRISCWGNSPRSKPCTGTVRIMRGGQVIGLRPYRLPARSREYVYTVPVRPAAVPVLATERTHQVRVQLLSTFPKGGTVAKSGTLFNADYVAPVDPPQPVG